MPGIDESYSEEFVEYCMVHPETSGMTIHDVFSQLCEDLVKKYGYPKTKDNKVDEPIADYFPIIMTKPPKFMSYYALDFDIPWMQQWKKITGRYWHSKSKLYNDYLRKYENTAGPVERLATSDEIEVNCCELINPKDFEPKYDGIRLMLGTKDMKELSVKLGYDVPRFQEDNQNHRAEIGKKRRK